MKIEHVCGPLNEYLSQNKYVRPLMKNANIFAYVATGLLAFATLFSNGGVLSPLLLLAFWGSAVIVLSHCDFTTIALIFAVRAAAYLLTFGVFMIKVLIALIQHRSFDFFTFMLFSISTLLYVALFLGIAFLAFQKSGGLDKMKAQSAARKAAAPAQPVQKAAAQPVQQAPAAAPVAPAPVAPAQPVQEVPTEAAQPEAEAQTEAQAEPETV